MHHAGLCVQHVIQQSLIIGAGKRTHRIARRFRIICRRNLRAEIQAVNARGASANNIVLLVIAHHQRMLGGHEFAVERQHVQVARGLADLLLAGDDHIVKHAGKSLISSSARA